MHRFFVNPEQIDIEKREILVEGPDVNHMKNVLRLKPGDQVEINVCGEDARHLCVLEAFEGDCVRLQIRDSWKPETELPSKLYLFQGLPKGDKMELIIQKAVELGVYEIIPVATKRAVVKLDEKKAAKKISRWNAIAESGAKQSGRSLIPQVREVMSFSDALRYAEKLDVVLIPYEKAKGIQETRKVIEAISPGQAVGIFIGPEGGFEEQEIRQAEEHAVAPVTLGKRILRTETAGLAVLSILMYHLESDGHNL